MQAPTRFTQVLLQTNAGDQAAANRLWSLLYEELRRMAHRELLLGERRHHTLSTTALVHEANLRLVDTSQVRAQDRKHFLALACRAMRQILVDYARRRGRQKRGGDQVKMPLEEVFALAETRGEEL